ncbi:MAG: succinate--CoA ligase subunit beta [Bacillota bacterium]
MNLLEHQGKWLLSRWGIPVPQGRVADSREDAITILEELRGKAVLKIQVPVGGRGKAGGIKVVDNPESVDAFFKIWDGTTFKGYPISAFLVEEPLVIDKEMYMSVTLNAQAGNMLFMFCEEGGVDIEEIAVQKPEKLLKLSLAPNITYREYHFRRALSEYGIKGAALIKLSQLAEKLYRCFINNDLFLAEINPLVVLANGEVIAADAKIEVDDSSLFRHEELKSFKVESTEPLERESADIGVTYIKLDGDIGIIASGAGLSMNTMDLAYEAGYRPANFLETGGGITRELMRRSLLLVTKNEAVRAVIVNLYGGVNPLVEAAKGLADGKKELTRQVPMVVKAMGNQQEECWRILEEADIPVIKNHRTEDAVQYVKGMLEVVN